MFYGYYQSLELELDKYLDNNIVPLYSARRKSTVLLKELDYWEENSHDTTPLVCDEIPVIRNVQHALGAMYVLEGSTMGGKIISKLLVQKLNIEAANPFVFFNAYGENTDTMWYSFLSALSEFTEKYEKQQEIINTAIVTFEKFEKWGNNYPDVS
jgi:heme oxygenase